MNKLIISIIKTYQQTLSPDHGWLKYKHPYGFCRMYPSCSEYSIGAFTKNNFFSASVLTIKRIIKCNPFTQPQIDKI